jgi:hypothetical protein
MRKVIYAVDEEGYTVAVVEDDTIVHAYSATNNPWDSQGPVLAHGIPPETLARWAKQTAREMAAEREIDSVEPSQETCLRG